METFKVICLSERDCCSGRPVAQIQILENMVKFKDRTERTLSFRKETWEEIKAKIIVRSQLPIEITNFLTFTALEKDQIINYIKDETNIDDRLIFYSNKF